MTHIIADSPSAEWQNIAYYMVQREIIDTRIRRLSAKTQLLIYYRRSDNILHTFMLYNENA